MLMNNHNYEYSHSHTTNRTTFEVLRKRVFLTFFSYIILNLKCEPQSLDISLNIYALSKEPWIYVM